MEVECHSPKLPSLKLTVCSSLKIGRNPRGKEKVFQASIFRGYNSLLVSGSRVFVCAEYLQISKAHMSTVFTPSYRSVCFQIVLHFPIHSAQDGTILYLQAKKYIQITINLQVQGVFFFDSGLKQLLQCFNRCN